MEKHIKVIQAPTSHLQKEFNQFKEWCTEAYYQFQIIEVTANTYVDREENFESSSLIILYSYESKFSQQGATITPEQNALLQKAYNARRHD